MRSYARLFAAVAIVVAGADPLLAAEPRVALVPWEVLEPGERVEAPLVLYWVPATAEELRRSELLTSYDLTLFSSRCVAMRVVRFNDGARLTRLGVDADVPMAVLTDGDGREIGRVESEAGALSIDEVEDLVREELDRRTADADARLDEARERAAARDEEAAAALYRSVWEGRCVCPRQGRDAKRALRKLGRK